MDVYVRRKKGSVNISKNHCDSIIVTDYDDTGDILGVEVLGVIDVTVNGMKVSEILDTLQQIKTHVEKIPLQKTDELAVKLRKILRAGYKK